MADKQIQYPSEEWLEGWIDRWMDKNPTVRVSDFKELRADAMREWWMKQIDLNNPTPFDLTPEQQKVAKKYTITTSGKKKTEEEKKQPTAYNFNKRERKADNEKQLIINHIYSGMLEWDCFEEDFAQGCEITNKERQITFHVGENRYELTLTKKRK